LVTTETSIVGGARSADVIERGSGIANKKGGGVSKENKGV
jgi:hypothetical protein